MQEASQSSRLLCKFLSHSIYSQEPYPLLGPAVSTNSSNPCLGILLLPEIFSAFHTLPVTYSISRTHCPHPLASLQLSQPRGIPPFRSSCGSPGFTVSLPPQLEPFCSHAGTSSVGVVWLLTVVYPSLLQLLWAGGQAVVAAQPSPGSQRGSWAFLMQDTSKTQGLLGWSQPLPSSWSLLRCELPAEAAVTEVQQVSTPCTSNPSHSLVQACTHQQPILAAALSCYRPQLDSPKGLRDIPCHRQEGACFVSVAGPCHACQVTGRPCCTETDLMQCCPRHLQHLKPHPPILPSTCLQPGNAEEQAVSLWCQKCVLLILGEKRPHGRVFLLEENRSEGTQPEPWNQVPKPTVLSSFPFFKICNYHDYKWHKQHSNFRSLGVGEVGYFTKGCLS